MSYGSSYGIFGRKEHGYEYLGSDSEPVHEPDPWDKYDLPEARGGNPNEESA